MKIKMETRPHSSVLGKREENELPGQSWDSSVAFSTNQDENEDVVKNIVEKLWKWLDFVKCYHRDQLFQMNGH